MSLAYAMVRLHGEDMPLGVKLFFTILTGVLFLAVGIYYYFAVWRGE